NNLCLNGGLKNREGYQRVVENNIIVGHGYDPHAWYQGSQDIFRRNIVSGGYGAAVMFSPPWGREMDSNLLQRSGAATPVPAADLQRQSGRDQHSIVADALFVDPKNGDFRVKPGSPALARGFKNFPMDKFGVQNPALKALAKTPFATAQPVSDAPSKRDATIRHFLGASIRDVMGQNEMSALGTAGETGVLLLEVGPYLSRAGLRKDDVLIAFNGQKTNSTADVKRIISGLKVGQQVDMQILHLQKTTPLTLRITDGMPLSVTP
ncbi:PDZ domain-containing protein, partial [bacterium]